MAVHIQMSESFISFIIVFIISIITVLFYRFDGCISTHRVLYIFWIYFVILYYNYLYQNILLNVISIIFMLLLWVFSIKIYINFINIYDYQDIQQESPERYKYQYQTQQSTQESTQQLKDIKQEYTIDINSTSNINNRQTI